MSALSPVSRRRLVQVAGAFFWPSAAALAPALAADASPSDQERRAFAAFVDVLLPRDAWSGSATDLGVDAALWAFARQDPRFQQLMLLGCRWLNLTGGGGFADLTPEQQETVVRWMSTSDWNEVPRRFFDLMRQASVEIYYSEPAAWAGLALQRPPQPVGYPPPWS